jgi:hypothetical protein
MMVEIIVRGHMRIAVDRFWVWIRRPKPTQE